MSIDVINKIDEHGRFGYFCSHPSGNSIGRIQMIVFRTTEDFDLFEDIYKYFSIPVCVINVQDQYKVKCRVYSDLNILSIIHDKFIEHFTDVFKNIKFINSYLTFTGLECTFKDSWRCLVLDNTTHPIDECKINREDL